MGEKERGQVFLRNATGLVRSWSWYDAAFYSIIAMPVGLWTVLDISSSSYSFPGANQVLGVILATIFFVPQAIVYAMLSSAMPRAGGEYVFESRVLTPILAYVVLGVFLIINCYFWVFIGPTLASTAFAPLFVSLATTTGNNSYLSIASWFGTPQAALLLGEATVLWGFIVNVLGMKFYALVQRGFFIAGVITLAIVLLTINSASHTAFVANFNSVAASMTGQSNAYQTILASARQAGFSLTHFSWADTLATGGIWSSILGFMGYYNVLSGEIKRANSFSTQLKISLVSLLVAGAFIAAVYYTIERVVGPDFNGAANYLFATGKFPLPVAPYVGLFVVSAVPGIATAILVFLFYNSWTWMNIVDVPPYNTRVGIAMAFDRVLPSWMADVNERVHTPVKAIAFWIVISGLLVVLYYFVPTFSQLFLLTSLFSSIMFAFTSVSGAILPFRGKTKFVYESSSISKYKFGGVPLISVVGVLSALFWVYIDFLLLTVPALGIAGSSSNLALSLGFLGVLVLIFLSSYVGFYFYNKGRGIEVSRAFQEIPPE